jgi:hypothetical protein
MRPGVERVDVDNIRNSPRYKGVKTHRCNGHLDDVIDGFTDDQLTWKQWRQAVGALWSCVRSEEGKEPLRVRKG